MSQLIEAMIASVASIGPSVALDPATAAFLVALRNWRHIRRLSSEGD